MPTTYWLGFGILSLVLASRGKAGALLLPLLAMTPPALAFAGIIWRDVLFATCWLLAAAVAFAASERRSPIRLTGQALALALVILGILLRPNALLAAPILAAYIVWLSRVSLRKTAIFYIPAVIGFFGIVQLVYYGMLDAKRQHPLQTIMIFDLGGISHFAKENQFPVDWSESENAMLLNSCYQPTLWDIYWRLEPCDFVMRKVEREKGLFGTSAISEGLAAGHPAPSGCLSAAPLGIHVEFSRCRQSDDVDCGCRASDTERLCRSRRVSMRWSRHMTCSNLRRFFAPASGFWRVLSFVAVSWRRSAPREAAFALGVCGSATVYVLSFYAVGVASDFRYGLLGRAGKHRRWRRRFVRWRQEG